MRRLKFLQRDIIISTITWHLGLVGSNNLVSILSLVHLLWQQPLHETQTSQTNYLQQLQPLDETQAAQTNYLRQTNYT